MPLGCGWLGVCCSVTVAPRLCCFLGNGKFCVETEVRWTKAQDNILRRDIGLYQISRNAFLGVIILNPDFLVDNLWN